MKKYQLPEVILEKLKQNNKIPILFDVDDVIHPLERHIQLYYFYKTGESKVLNNLNEIYHNKWKENDFLPALTDQQKLEIIDQEDYYDLINPDFAAIQYLYRLSQQNYEIIFYTAHLSAGRKNKTKWLKKFFPFVEFVLFPDSKLKDQYTAQFFIDDTPKHCQANNSDYRICFQKYRIAKKTEDDSIIFINNWPELYDLIISKKPRS